MFVIDLPFEIAAILILCIIIIAYFVLKALLEALYALVVAFADWWSSTAWPWIVETANSVWNFVAKTADDVYTKVKTKIDDWAKEIDKTKDLLKTHRVYQLLMTKAGRYKKRTWGFGWNDTHNYPADCGGNPTYKYGITSKTVEQRYSRTSIIGNELFVTKRLKYVYLTPKMFILQAKAMESSLLMAYHSIYGTFPPGNSKFG